VLLLLLFFNLHFFIIYLIPDPRVWFGFPSGLANFFNPGVVDLSFVDAQPLLQESQARHCLVCSIKKLVLLFYAK